MAENLEPGFSLSGQVVDGKIVLDPFSTDATSSTEVGGVQEPGLVNPGGGFVAVNAPFDPVSVEAELVEA